jgi:integrase
MDEGSWQPLELQATAGFHHLRASATTLMIRRHARTAQHRLGHSDPRLALGIYAQAVPEAATSEPERRIELLTCSLRVSCSAV